MSSLTAEQVRELTERINERFAEFDIAMSRVFERVTPGVVRLVFDAINEWAMGDACQREDARLEADAAAYERGREAMRKELGMLEQLGRWVADPPSFDQGQRLVPSPSFIINQDQIRADIRDHTAYPRLDDHPNGNDIFEGVHPVAGISDTYPDGAPRARLDADDLDREWEREGEEQATAMEAEAIEEDRRYREAVEALVGVEPPPVIAPLPELVPIAPPPTNGHHAELSPATTATLGPEHTVVTPLIPRRPRTLAEVDGIDMEDSEEGRLSRPGARAKKELDELRAKAAARARLGEVSREQMIAELRRQAMAGTMPTQDQFDIAKPVVWPKAQMLTKRFDASWTDLAREAGLKLVRR